MYESFYQLMRRPFPAAADAPYYFPSAAAEAARSTMRRCLHRGEGPALLIGGPGLGKSLLLKVLAKDLQAQRHISFLQCGRVCSRRALLQALLYDLGLPYRGLEEGELRLSLVDFLHSSNDDRQGLLIFIDEADTLPTRLLDELRLLTNISAKGESLVGMALAGGLTLEERFASPRLTSLNQRVAARCYLETFSKAETAEFVKFQLEGAGSHRTLFSDEALEAVAQVTGGVPRLINQLCDHTLVLASLGSQKRIDASGIEEAWADLQQMPGPWTVSQEEFTPPTSAGGVLEFGSLDDEAAELPQSVKFPSRIMAPPKQKRDVVDEDAASTLRMSATEADFEPASSVQPEAELEFLSAAKNPFDESFDNEEVILDRYASLSDARGVLKQVHSREGVEIASLLEPTPVMVQSNHEAVAAVDVVMPPYARDEEIVSRHLRESAPTPPPADDRDILIIEDHEAETAPTRSRRREFRRLFSNLRREHA